MTADTTTPSSILSSYVRQASISVAMCTHHGTRYLGEQLETIAAQTRQPMELVVTDDCSTDGTVALLERFAASCRFPVRIYRNEQQLGSTQNFDRAIRLCRGEYIALADQDDRWRADKLQRLGDMLDHNQGAVMVFSDATLIDSASQPTGRRLWESLRFGSVVRARFTADAAAVLLERPVVTGATMLFRQSLLERFERIPAEWVHDGWITWMSVLWGYVLFVADPLTEYRVHASQQLGVGEVSLWGRVNAIRHRQRSLYAQVAKELELLRLYQLDQISTPESHAKIQAQIEQATAFFHIRAEAPKGLALRLLFLVSQRKRYQALSGHKWRVLARDLFTD